MCTVSAKLKLCTCATDDHTLLRHYWVLKSPFESGCEILGTVMPPPEIGEDAEHYNKTLLGKVLNEGSCFDIEMQHREKDILELHFTLNEDQYGYSNHLVYAFEFANGQWIETDHAPFGNNLTEVDAGKISHALNRRKRA